MGRGMRTELGMMFAWLAFPMIPVVLEEFFYQVSVNLLGATRAGPDPGDWEWNTWLLMLGPLLGYGFLVGATAEVPDDVTGPKRGLRRILGRRGVWVAIGPWYGFLIIVGGFMGLRFLERWLPVWQSPPTWYGNILGWVTFVSLIVLYAYGWLWPAWAALTRAARIATWRRALYRGIVTALAFVGSLFGSFWAIVWSSRGFFFDARVMPMIALGCGLLVLSGCGGPVTYGEMRRRELFHAMLLAWTFALAMIWWWSSRRRQRTPAPRDPQRSGPDSSPPPPPDDR